MPNLDGQILTQLSAIKALLAGTLKVTGGTGGGGGGGDASAANQVTEIARLTSIVAALTNPLPVSLAALPSIAQLPTALTAGGNLKVSIQEDAGNVISVDDAGGSLTIDSAQLPAALAAGGGLKVEGVAGGIPMPVSGTFWQATQPVSGVFWQATQPISAAALPLPAGASTEATLALIKAKTDNIDVALSTRTKPADTQTADVTDRVGRLLGVIASITAAVDVSDRAARLLGVVQSITGALPTGANKIGTVDIATAPATAKGVQGANGVPTQALKDGGRVNIMWTVEFSPTAVAEALLTVTESRDGAATSTFTSKVITSGKRIRITSWNLCVENTLGVNPKRNKVRMRFAATGGALATSPLQANLLASVATAVNTIGQTANANFSDGIEFLGDGTKAIGFTNESPDWVTAAQTSKIYLTIFAFEY